MKIEDTDVCVHARSQHRGIYDTHDTTTAPYTARPFDAVEGATALSATRFHFMWTCVSADFPSSAPLLSPYFPFFHCRGLDFITGFEEPESALLPPSGSSWSSSSSFKQKEAREGMGAIWRAASPGFPPFRDDSQETHTKNE